MRNIFSILLIFLSISIFSIDANPNSNNKGGGKGKYHKTDFSSLTQEQKDKMIVDMNKKMSKYLSEGDKIIINDKGKFIQKKDGSLVTVRKYLKSKGISLTKERLKNKKKAAVPKDGNLKEDKKDIKKW